MLTEGEGDAAVRLARRAVAELLGLDGAGPVPLPPVFREPRGVFVTWKVAPEGRLRGCIGFPLPVLPLKEAIAQAAVAAAVEDPRFPPVTRGELGGLLAEVSVLGAPQLVPLAERPGRLVPGLDGVIVASGKRSGLLLPQVAAEQGWDAEALLDGTCEKAGLPVGAWRRPEVVVRSFRAEVFGERSPGGAVERMPAAPTSPAP